MKNSIQKSTFLAAALLSGLSTLPAAFADDTRQPVFQLNANVVDHVKMSRSELGEQTPAQAAKPAQPTQATPKLTMATPQRGLPAALAARAQQSAEPPDQGWMREYNVNWSAWMSELADRWYYVLQGAEQIVNVKFVTVRPAQIQFTCWSNGQITDVVLRQSCGNPTYDKMQMLALMQAAPLRAFPAGTKRTSVTLVQGWESHIKGPGEDGYMPGSFGKSFPLEKVREWVSAR